MAYISHRSILSLRYQWIAFAIIIALGIGFDNYLKWDIFHNSHAFAIHKGRTIYGIFQTIVFGIFIYTTFGSKPILWIITTAIITTKLILFILFLVRDYQYYSQAYNLFYYQIFSIAGYHYDLRTIQNIGRLLFDNNPISYTFIIGLYGYWINCCRKALNL